MDAMLQAHGAKHVIRVPEGLRELCSDISREVLGSQPTDIYAFIADYVDALLTARDNAREAIRVVNNIVLGSEAILAILRNTGLSLAQIAVAAPRLQNVFKAYLDTIDMHPTRSSADKSIEENSRVAVRAVLNSSGGTEDTTERAANLIQAAFRSHYEKMLEREAQGILEWKRAANSTAEILKRAGVSEFEARKAAILIQSAYRGYYVRRNMKARLSEAEESSELTRDLPGSQKTIQAVAWLDMMYEDSGLDPRVANDAATLIQRTYRSYRARGRSYETETVVVETIVASTSSLVVDAIVDSVRQRIIDKIVEGASRTSSSEDQTKIPGEIEKESSELRVAADKIETAYKERFRDSRFSSKTDHSGIYEAPAVTDEEIESSVTVDSKEQLYPPGDDNLTIEENTHSRIKSSNSNFNPEHDEIS